MAKQRTGYSQRAANPIETATGPGRAYAGEKSKSVKDQVANQFDGIGDDFLSQLLGYDYKEPSKKMQSQGEMQPGEAIDLRAFSVKAEMKAQFPNYSDISSYSETYEKTENKPEILAGIDYRREILYGTERLTKKEAAELQQRVQQILDELSKLISASVMLQAEFSVTVERAPEKAGTYHVNFFEWLLTWIRNLRTKTEEAGSWLSVMKSKKSQRKYGKMAKKLGTKFTLANERTPATQTG